MMRGRKPVPAEVKKLTGVPNRVAKSKLKAGKPGAVGAPFPSMSDEAKQVWAERADEWSAVLTRGDRGALRLYCETWAEMLNAKTRVDEDGAMILTPNGMVQKSPWLTKLENTREFLRKMQSEFHGTPSSRARLAESDDDESDPFDFLGAGATKQ